MHVQLARLLVLAGNALATARPVVAQELEEVTVTAQKRTEDLQTVPLSLTALTGTALEKQGLNGFRDWAHYVSGITIVQGSEPSRRTGPAVTIRGVTQAYRGQLWEVSSGQPRTFGFAVSKSF